MEKKVNVRKLYEEDDFSWYDYRPMLNAFGTIAIQVDDDDYQGDSRLLYDENGKIGYLLFGWGSCSGCDALQACNSLEDVQNLCDQLQADIKWFCNKQEALEWFKAHDWEGDYSWHDEETREFVQRCIDYLSNKKTEYDVTVDRDKYIGGSDIPAIMGLSPFTTRWELLLEKAGLKERDFSGNKFTEYGHIIEPKIRAFINRKYKTTFEPNQIIDGDLRFHTDGFNGECVLEIKSTSRVHKKVDEYKIYIVQLIKYMEANKVENGILAVYHRPDDFNHLFNRKLLQIFEITTGEYKPLLAEVNAEIDRFRADLARLKENPLLTEEDFQPKEVVKLSRAVEILEKRMADYKTLEAEYKSMKQALFNAMVRHNIKSWETFNGTKITRVDATEASVKTVTEFDAEAFSQSHPRLFQRFTKEVQKKTAGKSGYVKITLPKG